MPRIDDAAEIRALAYQIWEQEGCPSGREHEHWAQANRIYGELHPAKAEPAEERQVDAFAMNAGGSEIDRLRTALWTPEPFSRDLYPNEISEQRPVWRRKPALADGFGKVMSDGEQVRLRVGQRF
ncbi:DUF2934 domain-containing protein [Jiella sonneratiae]|uniref:DUF2934 domain-containing protein n=1 Tax=Jiella sonneratiae TaxID=2816856 RepID=A0ABS3IZ19_9HYPH|nr:DUF2934 domain-containing protein [Jiella sonneratiae]MBO0902657.1 DUF2934 domain-containing protein [Jiella sonneratiae]